MNLNDALNDIKKNLKTTKLHTYFTVQHFLMGDMLTILMKITRRLVLMQSIGNIIKGQAKTLNQNTQTLVSSRQCEVCGRTLKPITVTALGITITTIPACRCEVEEQEKHLKQAFEKRQRNEINRIFGDVTLGDRFINASFETFEKRKGVEKALEVAIKYTDNFNNSNGEGLLVYGVPGNGKSHLAAAIGNALKDNDKSVVFLSVPELLQKIRSTFRNTRETEAEIMIAIRRCDLLVLDDIGTEKMSDWVMDVIFRIIDGRYKNKKPIIYTTNYDPQKFFERMVEFDEIQGKRIYDRIYETSILIENKANSYRKVIAMERFKKIAGD